MTGAPWAPTTPLPLLTLPVSVYIAGENSGVLYAGASPLNSSGVFQVNVFLPSDAPATSRFVTVNVGGVASLPVEIYIR